MSLSLMVKHTLAGENTLDVHSRLPRSNVQDVCVIVEGSLDEIGPCGKFLDFASVASWKPEHNLTSRLIEVLRALSFCAIVPMHDRCQYLLGQENLIKVKPSSDQIFSEKQLCRGSSQDRVATCTNRVPSCNAELIAEVESSTNGVEDFEVYALTNCVRRRILGRDRLCFDRHCTPKEPKLFAGIFRTIVLDDEVWQRIEAPQAHTKLHAVVAAARPLCVITFNKRCWRSITLKQ